MTGESARHWIYVSGDVDIEMRAVNQALKNALGPRALAAARRRHAKRGGS